MEPLNDARERRGFSLIEVMIALGILAFGIFTMMSAQIGAKRFSSNSRESTLAMKLAERKMETLFSMSADDVKALTTAPGYPNDPDNPIDPDPGDGAEMSFVRRTIIEPDDPETGVIKMTVEVDWTNTLGSVRTARIQSLKADL
jgi:prepilin-type N-terminal cleavage/methylation domain-containing protein